MPSPHLQRKLRESLGSDAGEELAAVTERVDAIRGDIAELRHHLDIRFAAHATMMERALREQTRFFFLAWAVILAAIVGLYAR